MRFGFTRIRSFRYPSGTMSARRESYDLTPLLFYPWLDPLTYWMGHSLADSHANDPIHFCVEFYRVERLCFGIVPRIPGRSYVGEDEQGGLI